MQTLIRYSGATGAVVLSFALAACGSTTSSSGSMSGMNHTISTSMAGRTSAASNTTHNDVDVSFVQDMIVHHQGAIEMAGLATTRASSPHVKSLATAIAAAQGPEIIQMTRWLKTWAQPVTANRHMTGTGMAMGSSGPMGMMTPAQMKQLKTANGKDFDRMFLTMMTTHHKGAIAMATTEQAGGSNLQAINLAKSIQTSQGSEVTQMNTMLGTL